MPYMQGSEKPGVFKKHNPVVLGVLLGVVGFLMISA